LKGDIMRKITGNILVILSVLLVLFILNLFHNNTNSDLLNAYTPGQENCYPPYEYGPYLVNAMQGPSAGTCPTSGPPADSHNDWTAWQGYAPLPYSTPGILLNDISELCTPTSKFGTGYLRVTWTGNIDGSSEYIYLPAASFENQGCGGGSQDWSCYDYFRFYIFDNFCKNTAPASISQTAALYNSNGVTITAGAITVPPQAGGNWTIHYTASLNYLRNQYDIVNGSYLDINNIAGIKINAVNTDYTKAWPNSPTGGVYPPGSKQIIMYYDYLTLGADTAFPEYGAPNNVSITTAKIDSNVIGAYIGWDWPVDPEPTPGIPITGYHIYRSLNSPGGGHPYIPVGIVNSYAVNSITDTTCPGGNTYCYKVLILNNGPDVSSPTKNAINATYHESLLDDVLEFCGWVDAPPPTPTFTSTPGGPTPTDTPATPATATPTFSPTPIPTNADLSLAHVYPNPYNPNKGSRMFYVDNVVDQTKIYIYAMDGSLVKDGVFNSNQGRFAWNGLNKNGTKVVSGLYYLVLESPSGETKTFRIIVCYNCDPVYTP
jgi:hypothetical protein